jgi:hypothetical protein
VNGGLLQVQELNIIRQDIARLINGHDGCNVILHWDDEAGDEDEYGESEESSEHTETVRAHVSPVSNHNVSVRSVQSQREGVVESGDFVLLFLPEVDLKRKNLWFEVEGVGNLIPELHPPIMNFNRSPLYAGNTSLCQEIYARIEK